MLGKWFQKSTSAVKKVGLVGKILIAGLVMGASLLPLSQTIAQPGSVNSASNLTPRFNFLQGDVEMMRESTDAAPTWADPISSTNGQQVAFLLYFHNGVVDSTAHNTKFRVDLPTTASTQLKMTSYLWSDETAYITDTVVNNSIVGVSGGTINLPEAAKIKYVPGSTKIYRNGSATGTVLPDGITTSNGVNIGDVQGCWQYSGYVSFLVDLYGNSQVSIEKKVSHTDSVWTEQINANPGETVSYLLTMRNDGTLMAPSFKVTDALADYTTYVAGSTYLFTDLAHPENGTLEPDTLTTTGLNLNNLKLGANGIQYLKFKAKVSSRIPAGTRTLVNTGKIFIGTALQDSDTAKVIVTSAADLDLDKTVYNPSTLTWGKITDAKIGDIRTFKIIVKNSGNTSLNNVTVHDILPFFSSLSSAVTMNGANLTSTQQSAFFGSGLNIGTLQSNGQVEFVFQVLIIGCPPLGNTVLTNTAYGLATSITELTSSAQISVTTSAPVAPSTPVFN